MSEMPAANRTLPGYAVGGCVFLVISEILLCLKVPFIQDYFYILVWWSYIFIADGLVYKRTGFSIIKSRPGSFLDLLPWSVTFWLIFELFNLRLSNWHYIHLVPQTPLRWAGYSLSFATVLPGLFETYLLLRAFTSWERIKSRPIDCASRGGWFIFTGILFLALPLIFPRYCYPLVWGGFVLLLDPLNNKRGALSLMNDLGRGKSGRIILLLLAGLVCGFLWEFWNYWARAKWVYTVPFVGNMKIFEMPVLGFLGFPPFALECYVMYSFISRMGLAAPWDPEAPQRKVLISRALTTGFQVVFWLLCFYLIDKHTVWSFGYN